MRDIGYVIACIGWIVGLVLAKGFWSTCVAIVMPVWAWYLVIERIMIANGWL
jgi:hypothetical protein